MKIQLKRSNVLVDQKAKEPTADQMEYGELAVNYNNQDPAIFLKDNADNIIRISGREVPMGPTPPPNPLPGNFWFNPEDGRLYIWYQDVDSAQWVDASPDDWRPEVLPDPDNPANQPGTLDDRYVNITGDNMTGDLTLGTDKITLNATDGSATFAGRLKSTNWLTERGFSINDGAIEAARDGSSAVFAGYTLDGGLTETSKITADGSATFNGGVAINDGAGITRDATGDTSVLSLLALQSGTNKGALRFRTDAVLQLGPTTNISEAKFLVDAPSGTVSIGGTLPSAPNITLNADGTILAKPEESAGSALIIQRQGTNVTTPQFRLFSNNTENFRVGGDGTTQIGGGIYGSADSANIILKSDGNITAVSSVYARTYLASNPSTNIDASAIEIYQASLGSQTSSDLKARWSNTGDIYLGGTLTGGGRAPNISLNAADGSATFAGRLKSTNWPNSPGFSIMVGAIEVARTGIESVFAGYTLDGGFRETSKITADGSAQFAGNVTTRGVLVDNPNAADASSAMSRWNQQGNRKITFYTNGDANFSGKVRPDSVQFNLEPDNPANYITGIDEEGTETQTYVGPTLDVKDRLQKADAALLALKTAALAATDFASLQSAIVTALADI